MEVKVLNRCCSICGSHAGKVLGNIKMAFGKNIMLPKMYDIVTCEKCGFAFADTKAGQNQYNAYYDSDNIYAYNGDVKSGSMKQFISHATDFIQKYVGKSEKILDIGCGSGDLLIALKKLGYNNLCGLDPSQESIDRLIKAEIRGIKRNIFDNEIDGELFDVIVSTCVLEHICDLEGFMSIVISHLIENGKVFIVVPAVEGFERYYQSKANYFNHEHINYFSKISLSNLLGKYGCLSMSDTEGEFFVIENNSGAKDMMLQNIFYYKDRVRHQWEKDDISQISITNFLDLDKNEEQRLFDIIEDMSSMGRRCVVWGAGSLSMQLMANERFVEMVDFFVDNNKEKVGKDIAGKKIFSPDILRNGQCRDLTIVVVCIQHRDAIVKQINEMGIENDVIVY